MKACSDCCWFFPLGGTDPNRVRGICRVNAPFVTDKGHGVWPMVRPSDFCGQHEDKPQ